MRHVRDVAQTRAAEAAAEVDEAALIQRASWAVSRRVLALVRGYGSHVLVVAGGGHNGADALWAGAHLARRGTAVVACAVAEAADEHAIAAVRALRSAGGVVLRPEDLATTRTRFDVGVDGLTGIGFRPRPEAAGTLPDLARVLRERCDVVVAVDLPSGVAADTGATASWAQRADVTVTFGALKPALVVGPAAELAGVVEVADIGLGSDEATGLAVLDADDVADLIPVPSPTSSKYSRGGVGLIGGGDAYLGAAVLAAGGALRAGAGILRVHAPRETIAAVRARWPEAVGIPLDLEEVAAGTKIDAWVAGPGLGTDDAASAVLRTVLRRPEPVILDADAITLLSTSPELLQNRAAPAVLTPHTGEFGRITGLSPDDVTADPLGVVRATARRLGATVLLKGMRTVISDPDGTALVNPTGVSWLAAAGSGDVLAGAVGAYLAGGLTPLHAAACAAWLHGLAGRLASDGAPLVASDIADRWPAAVRRLLDGRG